MAAKTKMSDLRNMAKELNENHGAEIELKGKDLTGLREAVMDAIADAFNKETLNDGDALVEWYNAQEDTTEDPAPEKEEVKPEKEEVKPEPEKKASKRGRPSKAAGGSKTPIVDEVKAAKEKVKAAKEKPVEKTVAKKAVKRVVKPDTFYEEVVKEKVVEQSPVVAVVKEQVAFDFTTFEAAVDAAMEQFVIALKSAVTDLVGGGEVTTKVAKPRKVASVAKPITTKATGKAAPKTGRVVNKVAGNGTATDTVLSVIGKAKNGIDAPSIIEATEFNEKKVRNIINRIFQEGKVKRVGRGLYALA